MSETQPAANPSQLTLRGLLVPITLYFFLLALVVVGPWTKRGTFLAPLQARITASILQVVGIGASCAGDVVEGDGFSMRIAPVCDGLDLALILSLAILLSPASMAMRAIGVLLAIAVSQALSLARLVSMFIVLLYF